MNSPISELLTRVFSLLERSSDRLGCGCGGHLSLCASCQLLQDDLDGLLLNETQKENYHET